MKHNTFSPRATAECLPSADQERLARILDDYLAGFENGTPITPEELFERYPDDAEILRGYLSGLKVFHRAAAAPGRVNMVGAVGSDSPDLPRRIGDFQLLREIGRGGMGVVYEARQLSLRRLVALKILPFTASHDEKQLGRFRNEAQAAAQVQHPNIVPVYAVGEENGIPYYAMQLIPGRCLAKALIELRSVAKAAVGTTAGNLGSTVNEARAETARDPEQAATSAAHRLRMNGAKTAEHIRTIARLGAQAAEALHAAHEYGVVHRDIKPSNLLVDESGKLWVTDFGLARCRENAGLTQTGDVLGTMRYMSPEQALSRTTLIDHRTDIYSLGITLYELATLVHPADGVSDLQLYFERSRPSIKPLRRWNPHIPVDFQTIVMKSVSEFPIERYSTARELANDLERFLAGKPILATPPNAATRASKWAKRHRRALAAAMLVAFVGLLINSLLLTRERTKRELALSRSEQSLEHAHAVLDRFGSRLVDQLAAIPGAEGVRRQLLKDSLDLYQQFERQASEDIALAPDLGSAYGKMGSLAEKMGDIEQARELHTKACHFWEARLADEPDNPEYLGKLALCENNLAMLLADEDKADDALELLRQARHRQVRLAALDHGAYAADLAITHSNLGLVLTKTGAKEQAVRELKQAIALQERLVGTELDDEELVGTSPDDEELVRTSPVDEGLLSGLATSYSRLSSVLAASDSDAAVGIYSKLIKIQRLLVTADRINRLYQGDLARTYTNLGFVLCGREDWTNAEVCYSDAILIQENLVSASPFVAAYRRDLAISYNNLGMLQSRSGDLQQAVSSFRKAERLQQQLLADQATDVQLLSNQGSVLNNLGLALDRMGDAAAAESSFREAVRFQKRALDESPNDAQLRILLSRHYFNFARSLRHRKKFDEAVAAAIERGTLWRGQAEGLFSVAKELSAVYRQVSEVPSVTTATKDQCVRAAVNVLRQALSAGLPADRLHHSALAPLASHAAYRALLKEFNHAGPSPPSTHHAQAPTRGESNRPLGEPGN